MRRTALALALALFATIPAQAQREHREAVPSYRGTKAQAPIPPYMHTRNYHPYMPKWGGCGPSSVRTAALYHGFTKQEIDHFWRLARERVGRGGCGPEQMHQMLRESMPTRKTFEYFGPDADHVLNAILKKGIPACSYLNTGEQYGYSYISHWVDVIHYESGKLACFVDNNDPGFYHWLQADDMKQRAMNPQAWIMCFTEPPPDRKPRPRPEPKPEPTPEPGPEVKPEPPSHDPHAVPVVACLASGGVAFLFVVSRKNPSIQEGADS